MDQDQANRTIQRVESMGLAVNLHCSTFVLFAGNSGVADKLCHRLTVIKSLNL